MKKMRNLFLFCLMLVLFLTMGTVSMADTSADELAEQYEYDETPARKVKVNVTISYDGVPLISSDGKTVLGCKEEEVPYFDLGAYGLEKFYRYHTNEGKDYIEGSEVVRRPTALHLYIYLLEKYYLDVESRYIGTGEAKDLLFGIEDSGIKEVKNVLGETAYHVGGNFPMTLDENQGACHMYMTNFWGYTNNLNYYVNHWWPLWKDGGSFGGANLYKTGATADYILLEDGDLIELAMFTSTEFIASATKGFAYFPEQEYVIRENDTLSLDAIMRAVEGKECLTDHVEDAAAKYQCFGTDVSGSVVIDAVIDENAKTVTFTGFNETGTYYIYGLQSGYGTAKASCDPAVSKVIVKEAASENLQYVLDLVYKIGTVTYSKDSKAKIDAAKMAYDMLSKEDKDNMFSSELLVLTEAERKYEELEKIAEAEAKKKAEEEAKRAEEEAKKKAEEEAKKAEEEAKKKAEEAKKAEEESKKAEEAKKKAEEEAKKAEEEAKKEIESTKIGLFKGKKYKSNGVQLSWKRVMNLDGYDLYQSGKRNSGYKLVATLTSASYTVKKGLNQNKTYYYKIKGYKLINGTKIHTKESILCVNLNQKKAIESIKMGGVVTTLNKGKVTLTWNKTESMYSLKGYKIYQSTKKNKGFKQIKTSKKEKLVVSKGLKKGKTYYFKIQGYAKVGKKYVTTKATVVKVKVK